MYGSFPSWVNSMWVLNNVDLAKLVPQTEHIKGFLLSWISPKCFFNSYLSKHLYPQVVHKKGLFPSWTPLIWFLNDLLLTKLFSQILHVNCVFLSWIFRNLYYLQLCKPFFNEQTLSSNQCVKRDKYWKLKVLTFEKEFMLETYW